MPWRWPAKKDVSSCEKLRLAAKERRSVDIRMGKPVWINIQSLSTIMVFEANPGK